MFFNVQVQVLLTAVQGISPLFFSNILSDETDPFVSPEEFSGYRKHFMTKEQYLSIHVNDLRGLAKARGVKKTSTMKKNELVEAMLRIDAEEAKASVNEADTGESSGSDAKSSGMKTAGSVRKAGSEKAQGAESGRNNRKTKDSGKGAQRRKAGRGKSEETSGGKRTDAAERTPAAEKNGKQADTASSLKPAEPDRMEHPEKTERPERTERLEKTERPDRTERPEKAERPDRAEEPYKTENLEKPELNERPEKAEEAEASVKIPQETGKSARGILEVMQDGFGFLRSENFLPGEEDIYVSPSQIRRFNLKTGDMITGIRRDKAQGEKYGALLYVSSVNDRPADEARRRSVFEHMTPVFPDERIRLERPDGSRATRIVDLISPIGKGQRGMIVSPPKAGKTTLLKDIAKSILTGNPDANLIILLIDERPEEVTDMKESVHGKNVEIIYSTFDELPEHHRRVSEMVIERAKRLVEHHEDVIILLDSITRLTRAYNILVPQSGRTLSGGLDPTALYMPKRFFGAARNMREGGSLTILATALVDTGSKMDDVVYEEFKGTGNMELILDRKLQERRIFPAIDIVKSGTRRDDLLLSPKEQKALDIMHRRMNGAKAEEAVEQIINAFAYYQTNEQVVNVILQKWQS